MKTILIKVSDELYKDFKIHCISTEQTQKELLTTLLIKEIRGINK